MSDSAQRRIVPMGALTAAVIISQMIAAKATRDALFLTSFDVRFLPRMMVVAALVSAAFTLSTTQLRVRVNPRRLTGVVAVINATLMALFFLFSEAKKPVAIVFFLQTMSLGPLLASGFWSVINEALDPHRAKAAVGKISAGGTLGAIAGGLLAERIANTGRIDFVFLFLIAANAVTLLALSLLPRSNPPRVAPEAAQGTFDAVLGDPFLKTIAGLVAITVMGAALLDYALKAEAAAAFESGEALLRFFAIFYVGTSLFAFILQIGLGQISLKKLGVVKTVSTLPLVSIVAGGLGVFFGGLFAAVGARALETILRTSLYRAGYELLYTPVAPNKKRAGKTLIEVVIDRAAEAAGGGVIGAFVWMAPGHAVSLCFGGAMACGVGGFFLVRRLKPGYVGALAGKLADIPEMPAVATLAHEGTLTIDGRGGLTAYLDAIDDAAPVEANPRIATLLSGLLSSETTVVLRTLQEARPLDPRLVPAVIPLLDDRLLKTSASAALTEMGDKHVGQFADVLLFTKPPNHRLRARIAHLLGEIGGPRAAEALVQGLFDPRFEVRLACGQSLLRLRKEGQSLKTQQPVYDAVKFELEHLTRTPPSESTPEVETVDDSFARLVADRSERTTAHIFRLLALVQPREPIERAFKSILSSDAHAKGTAFEYLENVLPTEVWAALAPVVHATEA